MTLHLICIALFSSELFTLIGKKSNCKLVSVVSRVMLSLMHTYMRIGHQDLRKLSNRMHHHLMKVRFLHGNESKEIHINHSFYILQNI